MVEGMSWIGSSLCPMGVTQIGTNPSDLGMEVLEKLNESREARGTGQVPAKADQEGQIAKHF